MRSERPRIRLHAVIPALALLLFASCSLNQVGLGAKVDITAPALKITSPSADGTYLQGTIHLIGTVGDDIGVSSLKVSWAGSTGQVIKTVTPSGNTWTLNASSGTGAEDDLPDGTNNVTISATDSSGKATTATRLIYVDNKNPTILIQSPSSHGTAASTASTPEYSDYIDIKGEIYDASPLKPVVVTVYRSNGSVLATKTADGTSTFAARFLLRKDDATGLPSGGLLGSASSGNGFKYSVAVTDAAGNANSWTYHRQDIYTILPAGSVFPTVSELATLDGASTGTVSGISAATLSATQTALVPASYDFTFQYTSSPRIQFVNVDEASTSNSLGVNAILTATIQPPATAGSSVLPNTVVSKLYSAADLANPLFTLTGAVTNQELTTVGDSLSYALSLKNGGTALGIGAYRLVLSAQASGSSVATKQVDFYIENGAPYLDLGALVNSGSYIKTQATLAGAAANPSGMTKIEVYQSYNGGASTLIQTLPVSGSSASWSADPVPYTGAADGPYDYTVTLTTSSNKTTNVYHSFTWDTVVPSVTVNAVSPLVGTNAITGTANTFTFGASDTNGVTELRWWLLAAAASPPTWATTGSHSITLPPYTVTGFDSTSEAEGAKTLWVLARDKAGNQGSASQNLQVDRDLPILTETAVATGSQTIVSGSQVFSGAASDTNGLASLVVSVDGAAAQSIPVTSGLWTWTYTVDQSAHGQDGNHIFTFTATDTAGRTSTVVRNTLADTQAPTLAVSNPTVGGWVASSTLSALGTATDGTSSSGVKTVYVKVGGLYSTGTSTDHSAEDPVAAGWTAATATGNWSASLSIAPEGAKTLWVKALDNAGNLTSPTAAIAGRVDFGLDLTPPTLGFTDAVGTLVKAAFTLTGTAADTNPAAAPTVAVTVDGVGPTAVPVTTGVWSFTYTPTADGVHTLVFTATDAASKTATLSRTITVDSTKPTVNITQPGTFASSNPSFWLSGATALFSGTAADTGAGASGVASVRFLIAAQGPDHSADDPLTSSGWGPAGGSTTWSTTANLSTLGEGQFTLWTASVDNAGNTAVIGHQDFGVDQSAPTVTETNRAVTSSSKVTFTLAGAAGDTNALATLTLTEKKDAGAAQAVTLTPATVAGLTTASWTSPSLPLSGTAADGLYLYTLTGTDAAGKTTSLTRTVTIDTTPPTIALTAVPAWVTSTAHTVSGTATDPNAGASGVDKIEYQLDAGAWTTASWNDTSAGANTSGTWNATLTGLAEGNHTLTVRATDKAANTVTLTATAFGVDLASPVLTETLLGTTAQVSKRAGFTLTGAVTDTNPASVAGTTLTVAVSVNGAAATAATVTGSTWTLAQPTVDGSYSYTITATDAAGRTTSVNRLVLLDSTEPTLTVSTPTAGAWTTLASLPLAGTAVDGAGSGILKTYYLIDAVTADHTADIASWNATAGASAPTSSTAAVWTAVGGLPNNWTATAPLSGEGLKRLWVVSADKAGNTSVPAAVTAGAWTAGSTYTIATLGATDFTTWGATANTLGLSFNATGAGDSTGTVWSTPGAVFGFDLAPPTLTETGVNAASVTRNTSVTFSGAASDTDALASAHPLTVSVDGAAAVDVSFTTAPAWSYGYTIDTAGHTTDGTHTFVFTATDVAGKVSTVTRTVIVDTTVPTATVSAPASSSWTNVTPSTVQGTASDGTGSGVAEVWTLVDAAATSHTTDTAVAITTGGAWKKASNTTNWTASWALGTEGAKTLWLAITDAAGNMSAPAAARSFGYDVTAPALVVNALGGYQAAFSVTGTVADTGSGVATLQLKIDSGTLNTVTVAGTWTYAVPAATFAALAEGTHSVTLVATDAAGNQSIQSGSFNKDTTAPTLTYNNIAVAGGTVVQDTSPVLTGTLADPSGVASATYTLKVWNANTSTWNTLASSVALGSPAGALSFPWSLDLGSTGLNLPDGPYQIAIGAVDTATNAIAAPVTVSFLLSKTNPAAALTAPSLGTYQNAAFPLVGTVSDPNGVTAVKAKVAAGSPDFTSGTTAALPASPANVTLGSPGVFTTPWAHGLVVGDTVALWASTMPTLASGSMTAGATYYVQAVPSSTSFTLAATSGGAALAVTSSTATNLVVAASKDTFPTFHRALPSTVSGNTVTASNHHLSAGDVVYFGGTTLPTPATAATAYYVVNPTANTFQVSLTSGGTAVTFTGGGSGVTAFSPTQSLNWMVPSLSISGQADGALTAAVQATSGSAKTNQASRDFTLDTTAPTISLTSPLSGSRQVGNLTLVGTSTDGGSIPSGVTGQIQYQLGTGYNLGNAASWSSTGVTGGSYSWTISLGDMSGYANATYATECNASGVAASGTNLWKLPIVFQASDRAGNIGQLTTSYLILDPNGNIPVVAVTQPATGLTFGGQQRITGTASQPTWIHDVEVAVDPTGGSNFPANPVSVTLSGSTVTAAGHPFTSGMLVFFSGTTSPQIGGTAVAATTGYWVVNPTANTFQVSATSGGSAVTFSSAGSVVTATVWAPATLTSTGNNVIWYFDINTTTAYPQSGATSQTVSLQARAWNSPTAGGARGTISGALTAPHQMTFNSTFPKIQDVTVGGTAYYSQITTRGTVALTATVSSSKGIGKIEALEASPLSGSTALYDTSSSYGSTTASKGAYWTSTVTPPTSKTSDTFSNGNTTKVMITAPGSNGALWTAAGAPAATAGTVFTPNNLTLSVGGSSGAFIESDASGNFTYTVAMTIDSTQLYNATTGQYAFDFRATDLGTPAQVSTSNVTLNEDNYYPTTSILSSATLVGSAFKVQGTATDVGSGSGSIAGLKKVVLYLMRSGTLLSLKSGSGTAAPSTLTAKDMANAGALGSVPYPDTSTTSNYFASIDDRNEVGISDTNGDGIQESLLTNGNGLDWWAQVNTTLLADGPVVLHYVVWDAAGNATHYQQTAFISNNAPQIVSLDLGTDINGDGTVAAGETMTGVTAFASTGVTIRNSLFKVKVNSAGGNGTVYYSLKYGSFEENGTLTDSTITVANFSSPVAILDSAATNDRTFTVRIYDSTTGTTPGVDSQETSQTFAVTVKNTDTTPPTATLTAFNKATDLGTLGYALSGAATVTGASNEGSTASPISVAPRVNRDASVTSGGNAYYLVTNVTAGRTYNVYLFNLTPGTGQPVLKVFTTSGFGTADATVTNAAGVDAVATGVTAAGTYLASSNLWIQVTGTAATTYRLAVVESEDDGGHLELGTSPVQVSGTVTLRGHVHDDQRVQNLRLNVSSFNLGSGAGTDQLVASWNSTLQSMRPVAAAWGHLVISNETLTQAGGHDFDWAYSWNSALVTGTARAGVVLTVKAEDFNAANNGQTGTSAARTMDVRPYITKIRTSLSNAYKSNPSTIDRSALGHYPVRTSEVVAVYGYNLAGTSTTTTLNGTTLTTVSATGLSPALPAEDTYVIGANIGTTATSGALAVTVNSVSSYNNTPHNLEDNNLNNHRLTDDRYLDVWAVNTIVADSTAKYPHMRIDSKQNVFFAYGQSESDFWMTKNTTATTLATGVAAASSTTTILEQAPSKYAYSTMAVDQDATTPNYYAVALDTDRSSNGYGNANSTKLNFFARSQSSTYVYPGTQNGNYGVGTYRRQLEANWNGYAYQSLRSMYPDLVVTGSSTAAKVYLTYYDQILGITKFRYGTVGSGTDSGAVDGTGLIGGALNGNIVPATGTTTLQYKYNATATGATNEGTVATPIDLGRYVDRSSGVSTSSTASYYRLPVLSNNEIQISLFTVSTGTATIRLYSDATFSTQVGTTTGTASAYGFLNYTVPVGSGTGTTRYLYLKVTGSVALTYHIGFIERGSIQGYHALGAPGQTYGGGAYSAVGVTSTGTAVVAWYDQVNQALQFSWLDAANLDQPSSVAEPLWQAHTTTIDPNFAGWWVSLAVDGNDAIHLAYYDAGNAALKYAYLPSAATAASASAVTVDNYLSTGTNIHIGVKQDATSLKYVPYISYYQPAFTQTKYSLKVAYRAELIGSGTPAVSPVSAGYSGGFATGKWEVTTVPTINVPQDYQTSIGFRDIGANTGRPIVGYATTADLAVAQLK